MVHLALRIDEALLADELDAAVEDLALGALRGGGRVAEHQFAVLAADHLLHRAPEDGRRARIHVAVAQVRILHVDIGVDAVEHRVKQGALRHRAAARAVQGVDVAIDQQGAGQADGQRQPRKITVKTAVQLCLAHAEMRLPRTALVHHGQHPVEIIRVAARPRRRRRQVAVIVEQQAVLRRDAQRACGRQRFGGAVQGQVQRFERAAFERAVHEARHAKADAHGTKVGGAALFHAALRHAVAVHGQAHAQAHVRGRALDHDDLSRRAHFAAVARLRQGLRHQRVGADIDAHALGQQRAGLQVGEHRVLGPLAGRADGKIGIAARRQAGVGAHAGDVGGAPGRRDGDGIIERFDGGKLARDIESAHVVVELAAGQLVGGAKQGFEPAQQVGIAFHARGQAVLGAIGQVVEALFGIVMHRARRPRIQGAAHRQRQQQPPRPDHDA
ncbi:hypothetical protein D3C81_684510 [compost metagenome]